MHPFPRNRPPKPQPLVRGNLHQRSREDWRTARKNTGCAKNVGPSVLPERPCTTVLCDPRCEEALTSCAQSATIDKTRTASPRLEARNTGSPAWKKQEFYEDHTDPKLAHKLLPKMATAANKMQVEASLGLLPSLPKCCLSLVGYPLADPFVGSRSCRHPARRGYSTVGLPKPADQCVWEQVETSWAKLICCLQECGTYEPQNHHSVWSAANLLSKLKRAKPKYQQKHQPRLKSRPSRPSEKHEQNQQKK